MSRVGGVDALTWLLSDNIDSTTVTANADGTKNSDLRYTAFGEVWSSNGITPTDYRYTGQLNQAITGLDFYSTRWFDPQLGRWLSPDSVVSGNSSLAWDRYAYSNNNPINYNDPSGHSTECAVNEQYCNAGKLDVQKRASDLLDDYIALKHNGTLVSWGGLSDVEQMILQEAGYNEGVYNDSIHTALTQADTWYDPLTYIELGVGSLGLAKAATTLLTTEGATVTTTAITAYEESNCSRQITVLGKYPRYIQVAEDVGGSAFNISPDIFNNLNAEEQWALNQNMIDEAISRGDIFYLASRWSEANPGSWYLRELRYLFSQGYTISLYQNYLLPPQP